MKKDRKFDWGIAQEVAFIAMKKAFLDTPVLMMPDPIKPFVVKANASKGVMEAILKQQDMNGDWHPCGYMSKTFDQT